MSDVTSCLQAESLAGAIALGEARENERDAYRRHLAGCAQCVDDFGGEREIERTMRTVALARDAECWEPDLRGAVTQRRVQRFPRWAALGALAAALLFGLWIEQGRPPGPKPAAQSVAAFDARNASGTRAIAALGTQNAAHLEHRAESLAVGAAAPAEAAEPRPFGGEAALAAAVQNAAGPRASGTTALSVRVDAGGRAVACIVTPGSGSAALGEAACRAAMGARFLPRRVDGRAVSGEFHDTLTLGKR